MDYSKATSIHRLYGHDVFVLEINKEQTPRTFKWKQEICLAVGCDNRKYANPSVNVYIQPKHIKLFDHIPKERKHRYGT